MKFKDHVAMKKFVFCIAAVVALAVSCQKAETNSSMKTIDLTIKATMDQTKTYITYDSGNQVYTPSWHKSDVIAVCPQSDLGAKKSFTNQSNDGEEANFTGSATINTAGDVLYAFYPKGLTDGRSGNVFKFAIANSQSVPSLTTFNKANDLLVAKPQDISGTAPATINMQFRRVLAVLKVILRDDTTTSYLSSANVTKVKLTSSTSFLTGRVSVDITDDSADISWESSKSYNYVEGVYSAGYAVNGSNALYLIVNPTTLAEASTLTVDVTTDNDLLTIHKEVTLTKDLVLKAASVKPLTIGIDDASVSYYSAPVVNASDVEIEATDEGGTITYTVDNPVTGASMTASIYDAGTISNLVLGTPDAGSLTFTCDANTDTGNAKTATVRLTYTFNNPAETVTKDVTITQKKASSGAPKESHSWNFADFTDAQMESITGLAADAKATAGQTWDFGDGLTMVTNSSSKWNNQTIGTDNYKWVATGGKYGSNQKYFQFSTTTVGTVTILYASGGSAERSLTIKAGGTETTDTANVSTSSSDMKTVTFSSVAAGTIMLYSKVDNVRFYSISFLED
ncbi:MAG: hypothetical protein J5769_02415 [Bacteroidales bacterium]|nr:hypothetical protein [Bacteroidales bacterium]